MSLTVKFYRTPAGTEPVRDWLLDERTAEDRKTIGSDIKDVQLGWPVGMPLVRKMSPRLWEVRSHVVAGIARVFFTVKGPTMFLLHGLVKKTDRTPASDVALAVKRMKEVHDATP